MDHPEESLFVRLIFALQPVHMRNQRNLRETQFYLTTAGPKRKEKRERTNSKFASVNV